MKEVIWQYWAEMFADKMIIEGNGVLCFQFPEFPEPLMSANFVLDERAYKSSLPHFNVLSEEQESGDFFYHVLTKRNFSPCAGFKIEPLKEAIKRSDFWNFQQVCYPDSVSFMKRLLPFLSDRNHHHHAYIEENNQLLASMIVGESTQSNLLLNASVAPSERGKGHVKNLTNSVIAHFPQEKSFFWTKHPWLKLDAAMSLNYRVLKAGALNVN
jgi:hypothetical protein